MIGFHKHNSIWQWSWTRIHGINTDNLKAWYHTEVKISECGNIPKIGDVCVCIYPKNRLSELERIALVYNDLRKISKHLYQFLSGCLRRRRGVQLEKTMWEIAVVPIIYFLSCMVNFIFYTFYISGIFHKLKRPVN